MLEGLKVKIFADGADKKSMLALHDNPLIQGFTTNPTLMHQAGITNYQAFALDILGTIKNYPISFEVFSDDTDEILKQALHLAGWGTNVYVKIPVTNTLGMPLYDLIHQLALMGVNQIPDS